MERSRQHNRENKAKAKAALPQFNEVEAGTEKDRDVKTRFQDGERGATIVGETVEAIKRIRTGTIKSADVDVKIHLRDINASVNVSHFKPCRKLILPRLIALRCDPFDYYGPVKSTRALLFRTTFFSSIYHFVHGCSHVCGRSI